MPVKRKTNNAKAARKTAAKKIAPEASLRKVDFKWTKSVVSRANGEVDSIKVRMYRAGTGDCFLLQYLSNGKVTMNMLLDCGCIQGGRDDFEPWIQDLWVETGGTIELLVVTHQHADHINGFQICSDLFDKFTFQKVWFAWTEDEDDAYANELRQHHSAIRMALNATAERFNGLLNSNYFEQQYAGVSNWRSLAARKQSFMKAFNDLNSLNLSNHLPVTGKVPSMVELFKSFNVIKDLTEVEFLTPGDLVKNLPGADGIRFFVLGPPRDTNLLSETEGHEENYQKREEKSNRDFAFSLALIGSKTDLGRLPFDHQYEWPLSNQETPLGTRTANKAKEQPVLKSEYERKPWQKIDNDWLMSAGGMALRYEGSINNTSLALAIQFENSERVLLFPGDAEWGNWKSWHEGLAWRIQADQKTKTVNAEYLLNNTVFYKIGHHCSQNGSATRLGIDMMIHEDLAAMAPLNFNKINKIWLNTMPNDLLGADLLSKTKGKLFFSGDCQQIYNNIKTDRVRIKKAYESEMLKRNKIYDGKIYIDYTVEGK